MEITAINDSHTVGFINAMLQSGEVYMSDVKSVITRIAAKANGSKIRRLNIVDHGNETAADFGKDSISIDTFETFAPYLAKLQPLFNKDSIVHLQQCYIGKNHDLLRMFALTMSVTVYAGTGTYNSLYRYNDGEYVRCSASGTIYRNANRPG